MSVSRCAHASATVNSGSGLAAAISHAQLEAARAQTALQLARSRAERYGTEWLLQQTPMSSNDGPAVSTQHGQRRWHWLHSVCPAWPRHSVNLATLVSGSVLILYFWRCSQAMTLLTLVSMTCGTIFHGAHVMGHEKWADSVFMKYDFLSVVAHAAGGVVSTTPDAQRMVVLIASCSFLLWILTFGPLKGLPLNPIQSALHVAAVTSHWVAASPICFSSVP